MKPYEELKYGKKVWLESSHNKSFDPKKHNPVIIGEWAWKDESVVWDHEDDILLEYKDVEALIFNINDPLDIMRDYCKKEDIEKNKPITKQPEISLEAEGEWF